MKQCTTCNKVRPETDFHWHYKSKGIRRHACKDCRGAVEKARLANPKAKRQRQNYLLQKTYGITKDEYDFKLKIQNNCCSLCKAPMKSKALAVDHCHATGKVRELLCLFCNQGLGMFKDNPQLLREAADYIERHSG